MDAEPTPDADDVVTVAATVPSRVVVGLLVAVVVAAAGGDCECVFLFVPPFSPRSCACACACPWASVRALEGFALPYVCGGVSVCPCICMECWASDTHHSTSAVHSGPLSSTRPCEQEQPVVVTLAAAAAVALLLLLLLMLLLVEVVLVLEDEEEEEEEENEEEEEEEEKEEDEDCDGKEGYGNGKPNEEGSSDALSKLRKDGNCCSAAPVAEVSLLSAPSVSMCASMSVLVFGRTT